ncbi:DUF732 domain-containing protein [Mycolicibacterium neoaurum]|nr:DUF732 domain-containing protein [Mycolicibacterium neoaurum]
MHRQDLLTGRTLPEQDFTSRHNGRRWALARRGPCVWLFLSLALAIGLPSTAGADSSLGEQKFLQDMASRGVVGLPSSNALVAEGYRACAMLRQGLPKPLSSMLFTPHR